MGTVLAAAVLLSVAACAQPGPEIGFGGQPPSATAGAPSSSAPGSGGGSSNGFVVRPPAGGAALPAQRVHPDGLPEGQPTLVWTVGDGRTVGVYGREGGCNRVHAEVADQSSAAVTIVLAEQVPATPKACPMILRYPPITVTLAAPLGDRPVILQHRLDRVG